MTVLEPKEQAEILKNSPAEGQVATQQVTTLNDSGIWLSNVGGRFGLNFSLNMPTGRWDYVALCDGDPGFNPYGYMTGQWQYRSETNSPYVTGTSFDGSGRFWIMYAGWDYSIKAYIIYGKSNQIG